MNIFTTDCKITVFSAVLTIGYNRRFPGDARKNCSKTVAPPKEIKHRQRRLSEIKRYQFRLTKCVTYFLCT